MFIKILNTSALLTTSDLILCYMYIQKYRCKNILKDNNRYKHNDT